MDTIEFCELSNVAMDKLENLSIQQIEEQYAEIMREVERNSEVSETAKKLFECLIEYIIYKKRQPQQPASNQGLSQTQGNPC